ncbi:MAG: Ppx/GppA family phosphatase [Deltaproteobacteria bacterium]|jgi:exopolyphosphatase/guanosine-5'-triphosphate,3'-diphosphate pyrophosphatase|nr:Ppx/GppA family phosphatase [Deltaproteobacteria bacterium]
MTNSSKIGQVAALIDLGTNSVRLVIVRFGDDGSHVILKQEKNQVNLGEDSFQSGLLTEAAMERAYQALKNMVQTAKFFEATTLKAVATSALRQAENRDVFLKRVSDDLHLELKVISGLEEARLVYLGVSRNLGQEDRPSLIMDIGGGSLELIIRGQDSFLDLDSIPLGAARVSDLYDLKNAPGQVDKEKYLEIKRYVTSRTRDFASRNFNYNLKLCHGCAGVLENLARVQAKRFGRKDSLNKFPLVNASELSQLGLWLGSMTLEERREVNGLDREKAPIIVAGCAVVDAVLAAFGIESLDVVDFGLKHGLIYEFLDSISPFGLTSTRETNIRQLGRRCQFDEKHGDKVSHLAVLIYDSFVRAGLITLRSGERELLGLGALVHDIGKFLAYDDHQLHGWYLMKNSSILGFDDDEIALMAFLILSHRGGKRDKNNHISELYQKSPRLDYQRYQALGLIVAIAEKLESRRQGAVTGVRVEIDNLEARIFFTIKPDSEIDYELEGLNKLAKSFKSLFGLGLLGYAVVT